MRSFSRLSSHCFASTMRWTVDSLDLLMEKAAFNQVSESKEDGTAAGMASPVNSPDEGRIAWIALESRLLEEIFRVDADSCCLGDGPVLPSRRQP